MTMRSVLFDIHERSWALMTEVNGWEVPVHYGSQLQEHDIVQHDAGVFDLSHLGILDIKGADSKKLLELLLTNDVNKLNMPGQAFGSCILNKHGGIIGYADVYFLSSGYYRLVTDTRCTYDVYAWISKHASDLQITLTQRADLAIIAVQGPNALIKAGAALDPVLTKMLSSMDLRSCVECYGWMLARTSYTGEDGIEIILPVGQAVKCWENLVAQGIAPIGLAALDTLRIEAGINAYGKDMDDTTTPLESNLAGVIAWDPEIRHFIGREKLAAQKHTGPAHELIGIKLHARGVLRRTQRLYIGDREVGIVTSGTFSPTLQHSIALARVSTPIETTYLVDIRAKMREASVVKLPFIKFNRTRGLL